MIRTVPAILLGCSLAISMASGAHAQAQDTHAKDMVSIHALLGDSKKIRRKTTELKNGIRSVTESDDPQLAKLIKEHVGSMKKRLKEGKPIRDWDPLFAEIFKHHDKVKFVIENTQKGVVVTETSVDPRVVTLIQAHAKAVNGFVKDGMAGMHKMHPVPTEKKESAPKFLGRGDGLKTCPVTGEPVVESVSAVIEGRTLSFCCVGCIETVKKNPRAYLPALPGKSG